jgi:signal recognition particle subunit SRP54
MKMIPGMGKMADMMGDTNPESEMKRMRGIVDSMTADERRNPSKVIDHSRRRRIAAGAGVEPHQVNDLVKQFDGMAEMMKKMSSMSLMDRMKTMQGLASGSMMNPGAKLAKPSGDTGKRFTPEDRAKRKKERERELKRRKRGKDK